MVHGPWSLSTHLLDQHDPQSLLSKMSLQVFHFLPVHPLLASWFIISLGPQTVLPVSTLALLHLSFPRTKHMLSPPAAKHPVHSQCLYNKTSALLNLQHPTGPSTCLLLWTSSTLTLVFSARTTATWQGLSLTTLTSGVHFLHHPQPLCHLTISFSCGTCHLSWSLLHSFIVCLPLLEWTP